MAKTFTTMVQMQNYLESACAIAVKNTCEELLKVLQYLIDTEFYDAYDNETYSRTRQFFDSAMTEMLSNTVGMIFMNPDKMDYPFSGRGWAWDGMTQIIEGNKGIHGGWSTTESLQHHYWTEFEEYCDKNAIKILKQQLKAQGLTLSK